MPEAGRPPPVRREPAPSPDYLLGALRRHPPCPTYWLAYSGGLDSTVLLHLAAGAARIEGDRLNLRALHVHHGLRTAADAWVEHCRHQCRSLGIPLKVLRVDADGVPGRSPEESARLARYQAIGSLMGPGDAVVLAHHRDDQAETLLLQLLRGAGVDGMAAMPPMSRLGQGHMLRPLLDLTRAQLTDYATRHALNWVEDDSNLDSTYDRNFLRHEILPLLRQRWPGASTALARSARHCGEARALLAARAADCLARARNSGEDTLSVARLRGLAPSEQRLVLRTWIQERGWRRPAAAILERVLSECLAAAPDRTPLVRWPEGEIRRYRDALHLLPVLPRELLREPLAWPSGLHELNLPQGNGRLLLRPDASRGIRRDAWEAGRVEIRYRRGGESIRLPGRAGRHELRKLFQEAGIPPWLRERLPLVYLDGQLAAVGGLWHAAEFAGSAIDIKLRVAWHPPPGLHGGALAVAMHPPDSPAPV